MVYSSNSRSYGVTQCDWVYDPIGLVNITGGLGVISPVDNTLTLYILHTNTISPTWKYTERHNVKRFSGYHLERKARLRPLFTGTPFLIYTALPCLSVS